MSNIPRPTPVGGIYRNPVRLVDGEGPYSGRVEIEHDGIWGTVCNDAWGRIEAIVLCRQLNFTGGSIIAGTPHGSGEIWLDDVDCTGYEAEISDCAHRDWGSTDCYHYEDVAVQCDTPDTGTSTVADLRLSDSGLLYVLHDGEWGTVCDDAFEDEDATVACRQLGFDQGEVISNGGNVGTSSSPIWMDSVSCTGNEEQLEDCAHEGWGVHDCSHDEDVAISCSHLEETGPEVPSVNISIRLVGGANEMEGRLEVQYEGEWGTLCDDLWGDYDAEVVCRQLGFPGGVAIHEAYFGEGSGRIWLDDVECEGTENNLAHCAHRPWGENDCSHAEDAGLICRERFTSPIVSTLHPPQNNECYHCYKGSSLEPIFPPGNPPYVPQQDDSCDIPTATTPTEQCNRGKCMINIFNDTSVIRRCVPEPAVEYMCPLSVDEINELLKQEPGFSETGLVMTHSECCDLEYGPECPAPDTTPGSGDGSGEGSGDGSGNGPDGSGDATFADDEDYFYYKDLEDVIIDNAKRSAPTLKKLKTK